MVTLAPSPLTEWARPRRAEPPTIARRHAGRWARAHLLPLAGDALVGLLAAALVRPHDPVGNLALAGLWVLLLAPSRVPGLERAFSIGPGNGVAVVVRAGLALAFVGLVIDSVRGPVTEGGRLAAYVVVVTAGTLVVRTLTETAAARWSVNTVDVVVAGHRHGVVRMLNELSTAGSRFRVVSVCLSGRDQSAGLEVPVVHGLHHLPSVVAEHGAAAVIAVPCRHLDPTRLRRLAWQLEQHGTNLLVGTGLREIGPARARVGAAGSLPLIHVRHAPLRGWRRIAKQAWERGAAACAVVVLAPLLLALAVTVRLDSPGPALFRQTRVGRDGRSFTMLKLRTMSVDAEARRAELASDADPAGVLFKIRADPRITRVGQVLRRYSLDELPQLINVVRGEMALVGPRPPLPSEVAQYDDDTRRRLAVTPGLTGLWQVSGRSDLSWEESVRLDLRYVENWSLGLDLAILMRTARAVASHQGAY